MHRTEGGAATRRPGESRTGNHPNAEDATSAARRIIAAAESGADEVAAAADALFEAGEFDAARAGYARAFALGRHEEQIVIALQTLLAEVGNHAGIAAMIDTYLDQAGPWLSPVDRVRWSAALFDATVSAGATGPAVVEAALRLLEMAAASGDAGWPLVLEPRRRAALDAAFTSPLAILGRLEQESYAPLGTGLPALAAARAEEIGHRHAASPEVARAAERLLHRLGEREAAYRVEARRRVAKAESTSASRARVVPEGLAGLVVLIAGGHTALHLAIDADLRAAGVAEVRLLLPSWETNRGSRAIGEQLQGADGAVLIVRQLDHGTSGVLRSLAARRRVPVVMARSASVGAVREALTGLVKRPRGT